MPSVASDRPTALVTGANRGLGLQTAVQFREKGFRILLTSRDEDKGIAGARKLDPEGHDVVYHQLDITDRASSTALPTELPRFASHLDALANTAGIGSRGAGRS